MSKIRFIPIDLSAVSAPPAGTVYVAIDLDNNLKIKDENGIITSVGSSTKESNVIYVDATYGNDGTALINDPSKAFLTLENALLSAVFGDLIIVRRGFYSQNTPIAADGINWYFMQGAIVGGSGDLFYDNGSDMSYNVYGYLHSQVSGSSLAVDGLNSNVYFEFDKLEFGAIPIWTGSTTTNNALVTIKGNSINGNIYGISARGGVSFKGYVSDFITSNNITLNLRDITTAYNFYLECPNIYNVTTGGVTEVLSIGTLIVDDFDVYIKGNLISTGIPHDDKFVVVTVGGRLTIDGNITSSEKGCLLTGDNGDNFSGFVKVNGNIKNLSGFRETIVAGSNTIPLIVSNGEIYNGGYDHVIYMGDFIFALQETTNVKILLKNCTIHNDGGDYAFKISGTSNVPTAYNCVMYSNLESVYSASPNTINFYGCVANVAENVNITQLEAGGLITNANVILYS